MTVTYQVIALEVGRPEWLAALRQAIASEILSLGVHKSLSVSVADELLEGDAPAVAVVLVGPNAKSDAALAERIRAAIDAGLIVVPVVEDLKNFNSEVPGALAAFNGFEWSGEEPERRLAHVLLEQLDIEERDRRAFISHRRTDGLTVAEQLHDSLTHFRFSPFIDRFAIRAGEDFQNRIADALENFAFLLLLETPDAHTSDWVFYEVQYALAHSMGMLIVQWPGDPKPIPGSQGMPRLALAPDDLVKDAHDYDTLTPDALDRVIREVEAAHAFGLVRRRRMLLASIKEAAEAGGASCTSLKNWSLDVSGPSGRTVVAVAPRLPETEDLQRLDEARDEIEASADALLVHAARRLGAARQQHLRWAAGNRKMKMLPENAVGGVW